MSINSEDGGGSVMEDNGALEGPIPQDEMGGVKPITKRRFAAHVRRAYVEAEQTRASLDETRDSIDELREAIIAAAQEASMEREESHGVLQTISRGIAELTKTVADLANSMRGSRPVGDTGGAPSYVSRRDDRAGSNASFFPARRGQGFRPASGGHVFGTLGGERSGYRTERYGGMSGAESEYDKEELVAQRKVRRTAWGDDQIRVRWMLGGFRPSPMNDAMMKGMLSNDTKATRKVYKMLSEVADFDVMAFAPRGSDASDEVPLDLRFHVMGNAIMEIVSNGRPTGGSQELDEEARRCGDRVQSLGDALVEGYGLIRDTAARCGNAFKKPQHVATLARLINDDMATWTHKIHHRAASLAQQFPTPPVSEGGLPELPVPHWQLVRSFVTSGVLDLANSASTAAAAGGGGGNRKARKSSTTSTEVCRRFLQGKCQYTNCKYVHPSGGGGGSSGGGSSSGGKASKRTGATAAATTSASKKAKTASSTPDGGEPRAGGKAKGGQGDEDSE
ncbi:unnamed protein product [Ectocarpus fasciculatus]